jgi:hypothetical protein
MYATVRTYSDSPELADALAARQDDVKDVLQVIDGFRAYYLVKTGDGAVSVSVFDSEAGAEESTRAAAAWIRENLPDIGGTAPHVSSGEVVIDA